MVTVDLAAQTELSLTDVPDWTDIDEVHPVIQLWGGVSDTEMSVLLLALVKKHQFAEFDGFNAIARRLIQDKTPYLAGGIRVSDGDCTIMPGCCCGLKDWREQIQALVHCRGWLGHDPAPCAKIDGEFVQVWSDGGLDPAIRNRSNVFSVRVPKSIIATLESTAQRDLTQFLHALRRWGCVRLGKHLADELAAALDAAWQISAADVLSSAGTSR